MRNVPLPPPAHKYTVHETIAATSALPDLQQRKIELEEKGVVVFDPRAIEFAPEIYAPPSDAIVQCSLGVTNCVAKEPKLTPDPYNPNVCVEEDGEGMPTTPTEYNIQDCKSNISIPHFLSWATRQDFTMQNTLSEPSIESIIKILTTVDETLQATKLSRCGRIYRRSREIGG